MKRAIRHTAQDAILLHAVHAALAADERGDAEIADAIRQLASGIARGWGISDVSGLPQTRSQTADVKTIAFYKEAKSTEELVDFLAGNLKR